MRAFNDTLLFVKWLTAIWNWLFGNKPKKAAKLVIQFGKPTSK